MNLYKIGNITRIRTSLEFMNNTVGPILIHTYLTNISSVLQYIDGKVYRHFPLYLPRLIIIIWFGNEFINRTIYVDVAQHAGLQIQVRQSCWRGQHDAWTSLRWPIFFTLVFFTLCRCVPDLWSSYYLFAVHQTSVGLSNFG